MFSKLIRNQNAAQSVNLNGIEEEVEEGDISYAVSEFSAV
jgi:hypothetical protein